MVVMVKKMMVRAYDEVVTFEGKELVAEIDDNRVLVIKEKGGLTLALFNRWDYVRVMDK